MIDKQPFWNPLLETLDREKLQQLQLRKFQRIFKWAYDHSRFHRSLYDRAGITPADIRSPADIHRVPTVEKSMMRDIQRKDPFPYGDALCVPIEEVTEFRQTSGTTGQPVYQPDTWQDWEWWAECWAYILWAQGYRPRDRVFIPFGYNIFVAFWAGHYGAEKIGCEVVPGGVLDTASRILKIQELKATAMMATPTYVLGMADAARNQLGIDPATLSIDKITCAGECGASIPSTKHRMESAWGAKVYDHAGATEIGAWSYECQAQSGGLHVNEGMFLVEIQDVDTGEIITEPGRRGKMIITAFDRIAQPCVRFDSKDVIEWADYACPCGRTYRLIMRYKPSMIKEVRAERGDKIYWRVELGPYKTMAKANGEHLKVVLTASLRFCRGGRRVTTKMSGMKKHSTSSQASQSRIDMKRILFKFLAELTLRAVR